LLFCGYFDERELSLEGYFITKCSQGGACYGFLGILVIFRNVPVRGRGFFYFFAGANPGGGVRRKFFYDGVFVEKGGEWW
jgi:hypothetical protein